MYIDISIMHATHARYIGHKVIVQYIAIDICMRMTDNPHTYIYIVN